MSGLGVGCTPHMGADRCVMQAHTGEKRKTEPLNGVGWN